MQLHDPISIMVCNLELAKPFNHSVLSAHGASIAYEDSEAISYGVALMEALMGYPLIEEK